MNRLQEFPLIHKPWKKGQRSVAIVFPNLYRGGAYCFGQLIFYNLINSLDKWRCERQFFDYCDLTGFELVGFTFQYELDYFHFIEILRKNKILLEKEGRKEILFAGGPCVSTNCHTLSSHIDFFILGDAEDTMQQVLECYQDTIDKGKKSFLENIAEIPGVYVPGISTKETYGAVKIDSAMHPLYQPLPVNGDQKGAFGKAFMLEIERGCPYSCNFCSIPKIYSGFQCRSIDTLREIIDKGIELNKRNRVVIYSPSFTHPKRGELLQYLLKKDLTFSVPSLRVEYMTDEILELVKKGGQRTLTIAPEANESLRYTLGKKTTDEQFFAFLKRAGKLSFPIIKMYMQVGLPEQDEKDLVEMVNFLRAAQSYFTGNIYVSVNPFVPKPKLPFADHIFDKKKIKEQLKFLRNGLLSFRMKTADVENSYLEWRLAHAASLDRFVRFQKSAG